MIMNGLAIWDEDVYKLGSIFLLAVLYVDQGKVGVVREDPPHALHQWSQLLGRGPEPMGRASQAFSQARAISPCGLRLIQI